MVLVLEHKQLPSLQQEQKILEVVEQVRLNLTMEQTGLKLQKLIVNDTVLLAQEFKRLVL